MTPYHKFIFKHVVSFFIYSFGLRFLNWVFLYIMTAYLMFVPKQPLPAEACTGLLWYKAEEVNGFSLDIWLKPDVVLPLPLHVFSFVLGLNLMAKPAALCWERMMFSLVAIRILFCILTFFHFPDDQTWIWSLINWVWRFNFLLTRKCLGVLLFSAFVSSDIHREQLGRTVIYVSAFICTIAGKHGSFTEKHLLLLLKNSVY